MIAGNWYCQAVDAIKYSNVRTQGSYRQVVEMSANGGCKSKLKSVSGPLCPLNEEVC